MKDSEYIQYMINYQKQKMQTAMDTVTLQNDHRLKYILVHQSSKQEVKRKV